MNPHGPDIIPFPRRSQPVSEATVSVLIVCPDTQQSDRLSNQLLQFGFSTKRVGSLDAAMHVLGNMPTDVCLVSTAEAGDAPQQLAMHAQHRGWSTQVITLLAEGQQEHDSLNHGADCCPQPCHNVVLQSIVHGAAQRARLSTENRRLKRQLVNRNLREMVGQSPAMQTLRQQVQWAAEQSGPVLLRGETGTGIDLVGQAIHESSRRGHRPCVRIDCQVLSAESFEAEVWGSRSTSPDGSSSQKPGRLQWADGGTMVLENIETLALPVQRRLVPLIKQQRCEHPQTGEPIRCDVRIIVGTHANLEQLVDKGLFRHDLYDALRTTTIELPTIRERTEDIAPLCEYFLTRIAAREGKPARTMTIEALQTLQAHHWPGNLRELENVIERACSIDSGLKLTAAMLTPWICKTAEQDNLESLPGMTLAEMERKLIEATFARFEGNRERTAKALQIGIRTLCGKLREYGYPPRGGPGSNKVATTDRLPSISDETYGAKAA